MNRFWATACVVLFLLPCAVRAQEDGLGLDLTNDSNKKPEPPKKEEEKPPPEAKPPTNALTEPVPPQPKPQLEPIFSERDITQEDRVKSVQRKVYLKRYRFELAPFVSVSLNDPYYYKLAGSLRGAYYLADTLALSVRGAYVQTLPSEDVRTAKRTFHGRIFYSVPLWWAMGDMEWSPIYGKVAIFNSILHFDAYVLGGLGVVSTETSTLPGRPAADLGGGLRFVVTDFLAVNVAVINTSYVDTPAGTTKSATQNVLTLNAGVSIFFPFSSTGREAE